MNSNGKKRMRFIFFSALLLTIVLSAIAPGMIAEAKPKVDAQAFHDAMRKLWEEEIHLRSKPRAVAARVVPIVAAVELSGGFLIFERGISPIKVRISRWTRQPQYSPTVQELQHLRTVGRAEKQCLFSDGF